MLVFTSFYTFTPNIASNSGPQRGIKYRWIPYIGEYGTC